MVHLFHLKLEIIAIFIHILVNTSNYPDFGTKSLLVIRERLRKGKISEIKMVLYLRMRMRSYLSREGDVEKLGLRGTVRKKI